MALFKSQIVTQASGSVGGLTYSHNASGMYIRARSIPTNPSTDLQQVVRNAQSTLSQRWSSTLTEDQRAGWATYAKNVKIKNKQGDQINLAGLAMYSRCNVARIQTGGAIVDDAPTVFILGDPLNGTLFQTELSPFLVQIAWTGTLTATDMVLIYVSQPQNPTINFFKGPFRYQAKAAGNALIAALTPNPTWVAGQRIFVRTRVAYADGRMSGTSDFSLTLIGTPEPPDEGALRAAPKAGRKKAE